MGTMLDAANPNGIPASLNGKPALRITTQANPAGEALDVEPGNASASDAAGAVVGPIENGAWRLWYTNEACFPEADAAIKARGLHWTEADEFPGKGLYLWAADWTYKEGETPSWCPVKPLAVQYANGVEYDTSWTQPNFPAEVAGYIDGPHSIWPQSEWDRFTTIEATAPSHPTTPADPGPGGDVHVNVPVLANGSTGNSVKAVQALLGGLTVDGIYGPLTDSHVQAFQREHGLAVDGVVGVHTWGSLLGVPQ